MSTNPRSINYQSANKDDAAGNAQRNAKATEEAFKATDGSDAATEQTDRAKAAIRRGTK